MLACSLFFITPSPSSLLGAARPGTPGRGLLHGSGVVLVHRVCLYPSTRFHFTPGLLAPEPPVEGCCTAALYTPACRGFAP